MPPAGSRVQGRVVAMHLPGPVPGMLRQRDAAHVLRVGLLFGCIVCTRALSQMLSRSVGSMSAVYVYLFLPLLVVCLCQDTPSASRGRHQAP